MSDFALKYGMKKKMAKGGEPKKQIPMKRLMDIVMRHSTSGGDRKNNEKGVHLPHSGDGKSLAREYATDTGDPDNRGRKERSWNTAKEIHSDKLSELKAMPKPSLPMAEGGDVESKALHEGADMIERIMSKRAKAYSEGGMVANDTPPAADSEENDFDYLATDDDLDFHDTGASSGDELGEDDIVSRAMKARKK